MSENTCSICLEALLCKDGDSIGTAVPCGHCFHTKCFTRWKESRRGRCKCPNCNSKVDNFIKLFISHEEDEELPDLQEEIVNPPTAQEYYDYPLGLVARSESDTVGQLAAVVPLPPPSPLLPPSEESLPITPAFSSQRRQTIDAPTSSSIGEPVSMRSTTTNLRTTNTRRTIKELKVSQKDLFKTITDRHTAVGSIETLREDRRAKRIYKLKNYIAKDSETLCEHRDAIQSIQTDNLRRKEKRHVEDLKVGLQNICNVQREHEDIINTLYSEKLSEEQNRARQLKQGHRTLNETLINYGAALKSANGRCRKKSLERLEKIQQELCRKVHGLGIPIQSLRIQALARGQSKKIIELEREVQAIYKKVDDQGRAIQTLLNMPVNA